jgi:putative polyketide hydroxylase
MVSSDLKTVPVLVVGAGPAGLVTALTLAQNGVECLLVERRNELSGLPRATVVSTRSMELMRGFGLEDEIRAGGIDVEWLGLECATLARASDGVELGLGLPSSSQSALLSPCAPFCAPQDHLEPVLLRRLERTPGAEVGLGTEVIDVESRPDLVRITLRDGASGSIATVEASYLVAGDGAHSTVRRLLGIPMRGPDRLAEAANVLFRAPLWDVLGDRRYGLYAVTETDPRGVFLPAGRDDRWLFGTIWEPGQRAASEFTVERMEEIIRRGSGVRDLAPRIERIGSFTFSAQIADRFGEGRTFLVGDAAHRVTPRGGTGMNTAIHDGYDLGWKLSWVLRGFAEASLLDSFESERRPVVEHNVARSADPSGSVRDASQELHADIGGRVAHVWVPGAGGRVSTLDLLGPALTLFTGPEPAHWAAAAAELAARLPLQVRELDALTARSLGVRQGGALLARPDGVPLGLWPADVGAVLTLREALRATAGHTALRAAA